MGNLLGEPFKKYINGQIKARQMVQGGANHNIKGLQYLHNKSAWIKLASGTSFTEDKLLALGTNNPLIDGVAPGLDLAVRNVLFNGLSNFGSFDQDEVKSTFGTVSQFGKDSSYTDSPVSQGSYYKFSKTQRAGISGDNRAYGVGGTQQHGFSPMPGIMDADIKDLNRGSIKKATINLVAHNRNQFEVIDALYLRLGFSVMLEWGTDKYLSNEFQIENMGSTLIDKAFWRYSNKTYTDILPQISKMREKHQGNYDGMFGVVSNFSWTFEADGSYKIKLEIMSQGDVVESLKANLPPTSEPGNPVDVYDNFSQIQAAQAETTSPTEFFSLYPGLEDIITDWWNLAKKGQAEFYASSWYQCTEIFPKLKYWNYSNDNAVNQQQGREILSDNFYYILREAMTDAENRITEEYDGNYYSFKSADDRSVRWSADFGDFWRLTTGARDGSAMEYEQEDFQETTTWSENFVRGLMWINNIPLDRLLYVTWEYAKIYNWAGGNNDLQFEEVAVPDDATEEERAEKEAKLELEAKKDKNRINSWLYSIRNERNTLNKLYLPDVSLGTWSIGKIVNPLQAATVREWNNKVTFPHYPKLNPEGENVKDVDFIEMNFSNIEKRHYVRLGVLLEFIEQKVIPKIDVNKKYTTSNGLLSLNPGQPMLLIDYNPLTNICYTIDNVLSLDPNKVLLMNQSFWNGNDEKTTETIFDGLNTFKVEKNPNGDQNLLWGNIMNLYINFARIEELFEGQDEENSVSIYSVLKNIATDINESLGNLNNIEPIIDKETNTVKFIDQTPIPGLKEIAAHLGIDIFQSEEETILEIFGINPKNKQSNFIHSAGITTEISKEYATMITIGATANGAVPGIESTAFSKWNLGIKDRFKTGISDSDSKPKATLEEQNESVITSYAGFISRKVMNLGLTKESSDVFIISDDLIELNKSVASNFYKYAQAKSSQENDTTTESSTGFLPFNLKLKMDGLSGIKIYNKVKVNTSFLPTNYGDTLSFIVTGVNHKLSNNGWVTSLDTIATLNK